MRISRILPVALAALSLTVAACDTAKDNPDDKAQAEIVATWTSSGEAQIAPGLYNNTAFKTRKIVATFNANRSYTVVATNDAGTNVTFTGTYTVSGSASSTIRNITLNQTAPSALTSAGIFQVSGKTLKYEVIQTTPAIQGFTAPTAAGGFGSTKYNGTATGAMWTQTFTKP